MFIRCVTSQWFGVTSWVCSLRGLLLTCITFDFVWNRLAWLRITLDGDPHHIFMHWIRVFLMTRSASSLVTWLPPSHVLHTLICPKYILNPFIYRRTALLWLFCFGFIFCCKNKILNKIASKWALCVFIDAIWSLMIFQPFWHEASIPNAKRGYHHFLPWIESR